MTPIDPDVFSQEAQPLGGRLPLLQPAELSLEHNRLYGFVCGLLNGFAILVPPTAA